MKSEFLYKGSKIGNWFWFLLIILLIGLLIAVAFASNTKQSMIGIIALSVIYFMIFVGILMCIVKILINKKKYIITDNGRIFLPYNYKFQKPSPINIDNIEISKTIIVNNQINEKNIEIIDFLKKNPAPLFSVMIDYYAYQQNPTKYLVLETYVSNHKYYIVLTKHWFDDLDGFIRTIS